jgi:SAM-dependent methyltransferase
MPTKSSQPQATAVREHFRAKAFSFDRLYEEDHPVQRLLRPGLFARREFACEVVRSYGSPRVLDVGCGSGRVGEHVLDAGAREYVGVDFSEPMLELARERLARFEPKTKLVQGDFLEVALEGPFEVVLALGFFDYTPDPAPFVRRMREVCSGSVVGSFPRWSLVKGPIRKLRYEVLNNCPIFNYTDAGLRELFASAGFGKIDVIPRGTTGYLVRADV